MQNYALQQPQTYQSQQWPTEQPGTARAYDMQAPMNSSRQSPGVQYVASPSMIPAMSYGQMSPPMSSQMMPNGTPGSARFSPGMGALDAAGGKPPPFPGFDGVMAGGSLATNVDAGMSIYSSAQGKNAWDIEGAGIFDPSGNAQASPASPNRFGILSGAGTVPPFPQPQSPQPSAWGAVDSTQTYPANKPGEKAQEAQYLVAGAAKGHAAEMGGGAGKRQAGTSNKKASGFVGSISKSFSKLMCGGNALKNIDDDDIMVMQVQSPVRGPARSPTRSPAMKPSGSFRPRLCALDFDLTLTQNQVLLYNNDENTLDMNMLFGRHRLDLIRDFCTALFEGGITLVIVTFNLKWVVEMVLRKLGVLHMFTEIYDRFEVHQALGKPSLMAVLIAKYGVTGDTAILVDDDINNLNGCPCRTLHITGDMGMAQRDVTNVLEQMDVRGKKSSYHEL